MSSLVSVALVPPLGIATLVWVPDDLFVVVSVLLVGTVALALLGLESGTAFGGMGSSRHMMIAALVEPTVLVAVYALSVPVGTTALSAILQARMTDPATVVSPVSLLALVALTIVVLAETGRLPVDNPATHLELTMVHEAMVLESSGRDLGWLELGSWLRLTALLGLVVNLALPWGCGGVRVDPMMQYTATSYAEPLVRVFDDALQPTRDLDVTHTTESRYLVRAVAFRQRMVDQVERGLYQPLLGVLEVLGDLGRRAQNGSIQRYLGFSFTALVVVLLVVTW